LERPEPDLGVIAKSVRAAKRLGWSAAAQVTSNASNFVLTVLVARTLDVAQLGVFAILMAVNGVAIGVVRAWTSEPMIFKEADTRQFNEGDKHSASLLSTVLVSVVVGFVSALTVSIVASDTPLAIAFGVAIFFAVVQDSVRFALVDSGKAAQAFGAEALWLLVEVPVILAITPTELSQFVSAWGLGAAASVLCGFLILRPRLDARLAAKWVRSVKRVGPVYSVDYFVAGGLIPAVTFVVSAVSGLEASGWLRAAQMLLMPLSIFTMGMNFALIPEATRLVASGDVRASRRLPALYGACVVLVAVICIVVYQMLPSEISVALMGEAAEGGLTVLPFTAIALSVAAISVGPGLILRAMGMVRASMLIKVFAAPVTLIAVAVGAAWGGAIGSQVGLAGGTATRAVGSWVLMSSSLKSRSNSRSEETS
jgi:O-antigen/teichoic acid export membrane protein